MVPALLAMEVLPAGALELLSWSQAATVERQLEGAGWQEFETWWQERQWRSLREAQQALAAASGGDGSSAAGSCRSPREAPAEDSELPHGGAVGLVRVLLCAPHLFPLLRLLRLLLRLLLPILLLIRCSFRLQARSAPIAGRRGGLTDRAGPGRAEGRAEGRESAVFSLASRMTVIPLSFCHQGDRDSDRTADNP